MADISAALVNMFSETFVGHKKYYGQSIPTGEKTDKGKLIMKSFTKSQSKGDPVLDWKLYQLHLQGKKGLGIAPIDENNNCRFGVLDVDDYSVKPERFMEMALDYNLPFNLFRSKSGGLHCYLFFAEDIKAVVVRDIMKKFLIIFGLDSKTEIFPKQERLFTSSSPSWINLPYFGGTDSYMYDANCKPMTLDMAMFHINENRVSRETLKERYEALPLSDGPMCLQSLFLRSKSMQDGDGRNNYLFNMGIYYKAQDSTRFEENIMGANSLLEHPKKEVDILNQIVKPIQKKSYSYRCSDHPLCDNCYADLCKERKFGKGGDEISSLSFEELRQIQTDPPHYIWLVNGKEMVFYKESELREQYSFADQCMRLLHTVPNIVKRDRWTEILNKAFREVVVVPIDEYGDLSPGALLWEYFREYISDRPRAQSKEQIKAGYIFKDEDQSIYVFKKKNLLQYLQNDKQFRFFPPTELQKRLFDKGVGAKVYYMGEGASERVWFVPVVSVKAELKLADDVVDFIEFKKTEEEF